MFCFSNSDHVMFSRELAFCLSIIYAYICTWMHLHRTSLARNSSHGCHHVVKRSINELLNPCLIQEMQSTFALIWRISTKGLNDYRPFYLGVFIALFQFMWPLQGIVSGFFKIIIFINFSFPCRQVNRVITEKRFSGVTARVT